MNDRVRIGDAEREEAARELGEHYAMGRITTEEHSERLEKIWDARTQGELTPVFGDLPRPKQPEPRRSPSSSRTRTRAPRSRVQQAPRVPFLFKALVAIVAIYFLWSHFTLLVVLLLVYLLVVRRIAHRGRWHDHHAHWR